MYLVSTFFIGGISLEVLCVKKSVLPMSVNLQKEDTVIKKMLDNLVYIDESNIPKEYVRVDVAVSVRSAYTNKVVMCKHSDSEEERCFLNLTKIPKVPQTGYELIMMISSVAVTKMCDTSNLMKLSGVMMKSKYNFMGVINLDPELLSPIIYSHVILEDNTIEDFESLLNEGFRVIPISDIPKSNSFRAMKESLVICKEERE